MFPFRALFPEIARNETRSLHDLRDGEQIPRYAFEESYCVEPDCDCRRLLVRVLEPSGKQAAVISHSFEPDPQGELAQTFLDPLNSQGPEAGQILATFVHLVLTPDYAARLERHYRLVKDALLDPSSHVHAILRANPPGPSGGPRLSLPLAAERRTGKKVGRNDPCPCGSDKKFKKCCGA
jgi:hypothetical protein